MLCLHGADIDPGASEQPDEGDWTDAQRAILMNVVTFGAMYLSYGYKDIGMASHAEASFMDGVEVPYETLEEQRRAETVVPPAATWIFLAGDKIYELCKLGKLDKGRGFSLGRWAIWKRRFSEIAANERLMRSVTLIAARAAFKMGKIEG